MKSINQIKSTIKYQCTKLAIRANYLLNKYRETIWLLGDGRSGTTWVCDLINYEKKYREMFEPFHPRYISDVNFIVPHQYIRPYELDDEIKKVANDIFSGKFTHERVDSANHFRLYEGIIVKDIFANLLCYSLWLNFQKVKPVLLLRNPFAVSLSKLKKKSWFWMTDPMDLLNQKHLYADYLYAFEDLIKQTSAKRNYILNQILIWSIINYIPLRQFHMGSIHICFYEKIYMDPEKEIRGIFEFIENSPKINLDKVKLRKIISRPSRMAGKGSNMLIGASPIASWKDEIPPNIIDEGFNILQHFGFENLYDDESIPNEDVIKKMVRHEVSGYSSLSLP